MLYVDCIAKENFQKSIYDNFKNTIMPVVVLNCGGSGGCSLGEIIRVGSRHCRNKILNIRQCNIHTRSIAPNAEHSTDISCTHRNFGICGACGIISGLNVLIFSYIKCSKVVENDALSVFISFAGYKIPFLVSVNHLVTGIFDNIRSIIFTVIPLVRPIANLYGFIKVTISSSIVANKVIEAASSHALPFNYACSVIHVIDELVISYLCNR